MISLLKCCKDTKSFSSTEISANVTENNRVSSKKFSTIQSTFCSKSHNFKIKIITFAIPSKSLSYSYPANDQINKRYNKLLRGYMSFGRLAGTALEFCFKIYSYYWLSFTHFSMLKKKDER